MTIETEFTHFHLFCGLGGGAAGFNRGTARLDNTRARFRCLGGIDSDPAIVRDFEKLAGVPGTCLDLFDRDQYTDWHGHEPPAGWREATPEDIRRAAGNERPNIVFTSPPCKGFSGLLNSTRSKTAKYQALNRLTLRGLWLTMEAWADDPPEFLLLENVPRIASRGRHLLDQINSLLEHYGYAVAETTHDCGELGGLAQSRKRFLLVARHQEKVPPFLYEPRTRPLRAVGDVLGRMPLAGDTERGGPMHRVPRLQWRTWLRLALIEAGSDWRSLQGLAVEDGYLRDFGIVPDAEYHRGYMGVREWDKPTGTVTGKSRATTGAHAVADPRLNLRNDYGSLGVRSWETHAATVTSQRSPGQGPFSIADPRTPVKHNNCFRVVRLDGTAGTVTGGSGPSSGGQAVADVRPPAGPQFGKYHVTPFDRASRTVIGGESNGAAVVADPRPGLQRSAGDHYLTGGHYGVVPWTGQAYAVTGSGRHDNGWNNVADPRMPGARDQLVCVIRSLDGTWHRPFTTLELAALQSLVDPEEKLELDGLSDSAWRERIGNAVPPSAAEAIAGVMGQTLLAVRAEQTFMLDCMPIWVQPVAVAIALPGRQSA